MGENNFFNKELFWPQRGFSGSDMQKLLLQPKPEPKNGSFLERVSQAGAQWGRNRWEVGKRRHLKMMAKGGIIRT